MLFTRGVTDPDVMGKKLLRLRAGWSRINATYRQHGSGGIPMLRCRSSAHRARVVALLARAGGFFAPKRIPSTSSATIR